MQQTTNNTKNGFSAIPISVAADMVPPVVGRPLYAYSKGAAR